MIQPVFQLLQSQNTDFVKIFTPPHNSQLLYSPSEFKLLSNQLQKKYHSKSSSPLWFKKEGKQDLSN